MKILRKIIAIEQKPDGSIYYIPQIEFKRKFLGLIPYKKILYADPNFITNNIPYSFKDIGRAVEVLDQWINITPFIYAHSFIKDKYE